MSPEESHFRLRLPRLVQELASAEVDVRRLTPLIGLIEDADIPETNAQLMLAVRALEEAQDRLNRAAAAARLP